MNGNDKGLHHHAVAGLAERRRQGGQALGRTVEHHHAPPAQVPPLMLLEPIGQDLAQAGRTVGQLVVALVACVGASRRTEPLQGGGGVAGQVLERVQLGSGHPLIEVVGDRHGRLPEVRRRCLPNPPGHQLVDLDCHGVLLAVASPGGATVLLPRLVETRPSVLPPSRKRVEFGHTVAVPDWGHVVLHLDV